MALGLIHMGLRAIIAIFMVQLTVSTVSSRLLSSLPSTVTSAKWCAGTTLLAPELSAFNRDIGKVVRWDYASGAAFTLLSYTFYMLYKILSSLLGQNCAW
ncbi:hypothetical protein SKAU_G00256810 [Synaphobranchus kaupii]|uniref:Uncharacterized protein n=1 Tax=Synaphobranchus kaupii TaxID=118154 RepID=A0A9Q1F409_SYNKA|nr:hypothetical protein SKAU_G00256810 [Synaphobranchus kaupii]